MKHRNIAIALVAGVVSLASSAAYAGSIEIHDAWAAPTEAGKKAGSVFMTINNSGESDAIVSIETAAAKMAQMHNSKLKGDKVRMRRSKTYAVPAGKTMFMPKGDHIMLMKVAAPLAMGGKFPITLTFEKAGKVTTEVHVKMAKMGSSHKH